MNTPSIFPNRYAFLIGVQAYSDSGIRPLKTPAQDIQLMAGALQAYGYQTNLCLNPDKATFSDFLTAISAKTSDVPEQIIIYYAGHGVALTHKQTDVANQPDTYGGYLLPTDANRSQLAESAVSLQWLAQLIEQLNAKQVLLILDCCYAGAVRQAASGFRGGIDTDLEDISQDDFQHFTRYRANQILTSSAHNQQALDQYVSSDVDDQIDTSPFATLLARALTNREADANRDGIITVYELQLYIQQRLEATAQEQQHEQTSCLFAFSSHEGGEFVFLDPAFNPSTLKNRQRINPYKGLDSYQPQDKAFFFGRDSAIKELNRLLDGTSFLVVVGASGTGKSSLVKAGILGSLSPADYATIRPGKEPLVELERIRQQPPRLLLIDQMEELITQSSDRSDEYLVHFFNELTAFQQSAAGHQTKIIATIRIEFVPQFNRQERFWNTNRQQFTIPVLDVEALQEIIIRPALQTGMFFYPEKETVARIIEDFRHYPNALPLLSLALNDLYETCKDRPERTIYERDYPGIGQILEHKEQTILEPFRANIDFFRDLMLRFVAFQGGEYVRRRVSHAELNFGPDQQQLCQQILTVLSENRLVAGRDPESGDGYYELTHEALIGSWQTYRQWIQQTGPTQLLQREELAEAASRYGQMGRSRAYVWGSVPLRNLIRLGKPINARISGLWVFSPFGSQFGHLTWLSVLERAFLKRSFGVQRINKLLLGGLGFLIFIAIGIALFLQSQESYTRLLGNARLAESQNAYSTAQRTYLTADTLFNTSLLLRAGQQFLPVSPGSLRMYADSAGKRELLFSTLSRRLEQADSLANLTVQLLNERANATSEGTGVAKACRSYRQFIHADSLYRSLENNLSEPRTRTFLDSKTLIRFKDRAKAGYQNTDVMRTNLLATCREVQEGYQLNGQTKLADQYGRYAHQLESYARTLKNKPAAPAVAGEAH